MKNIIIPNKELRLLSNQLQTFNVGYTVNQIRSLDKVIRIMEEVNKSFTEGLEGIMNIPVSTIPEKKKEDEEKKAKDLDSYITGEGAKKVTCSFEDSDYEFIKLVWSKIATFSGQKEARDAVLIIDDAINSANEPVFTNGKEEKVSN
jgi:hypothetical protein